MARVMPLPSSKSSTLSRASRSTPSVTRTICPWLIPAERSKSMAWPMAAAVLLPGTGIMSGVSTGRRLAIVGLSSVRGVTMWESPA